MADIAYIVEDDLDKRPLWQRLLRPVSSYFYFYVPDVFLMGGFNGVVVADEAPKHNIYGGLILSPFRFVYGQTSEFFELCEEMLEDGRYRKVAEMERSVIESREFTSYRQIFEDFVGLYSDPNPTDDQKQKLWDIIRSTELVLTGEQRVNCFSSHHLPGFH
jgi:hypothetical protein